MAEIKKIRPSNPVSDYQRVTPAAGTGFMALAEMANDAYNFLEPGAIAEQMERGTEHGREPAKQLMAENRVPQPEFPQPNVSGGGVQSNGSSRGSHAIYRDAIAKVESEGSGDYAAIGPVTKKGNRAYGRYQVMDFNIGPWTKKHLGRRLTTQEFLNDPQAQDAVFDGEFGSYVEKYGNPQDAASVWFSGRPMSQAGNSSDGFNTVPQYVQKFNAAIKANANGTLAGGGFDDTVEGGSLNDTFDDPAVTEPESVADAAMAALGKDGAQQVVPGDQRQPTEPETTVRTSDGKIEARLYSPMSGPILQAHNAAAGVAYISEVSTSGFEDLMNLSLENRGQPRAFREAAESYLKTVLEAAPKEFQGDIQANLMQEVQRRYLGMVDEQHRETRKRADNSSRALMERFTQNYAESLASGRSEEAEAAKMQLQQVLLARESLPGSAWTREQSENVMIGADKDAERMMISAEKKIKAEWDDTLDMIIKAREAGRTAEDETILNDPSVWGALPDKAREAASRIAFNDAQPGFVALPPAEQAAQIRQESERPVGEDYELDFATSMKKMHAASVKGWNDDPIDFAGKNLAQTDFGPPPALDMSMALSDPQGFGKAVRERAKYAHRLKQAGYTKTIVPLSVDEASQFGALLSAEHDPVQRAALVAALASVAPSITGPALRQAGADNVLRFGGEMAAQTGNPQLLSEAIRGQEMIKTGQVSLPKSSGNMNAIAPEMPSALEGLPAAASVQGRVMEFAESLYAARAVGVSDEAKQTRIMKQAVNEALGQSVNAGGDLTGGIQSVMGSQTLLPIGVSAGQVEEIMGQRDEWDAFGEAMYSGDIFMRDLGPANIATMEQWQGASRFDSMPTFNGTPLTQEAFDSGRLRLVATGGPFYRMEYLANGSVIDVQNSNGTVFEFDLKKMLETQ